MAPMATTYTPKFLKRPAPPVETPVLNKSEHPASKKVKRSHFRYPRARYDFQRAQRQDASIQDERRVQDMLERSISLALEAVGFVGADAEAVESFRLGTEEYMAHYLRDVRQSMLSCRRSQPIPQDFLQSLHTHQLSLRSLTPHLKPPVPPRKSQYHLQSDGAEEEGWPKDPDILGSLLSDGDKQKMKRFIPKHFPVLPSMHTYQATAEFVQREEDPRKIRERATEEGRLGEEALRKLATYANTNSMEVTNGGTMRQSAKEKRRRLWLETMEAVTQEHTDTVNADAAFSINGNGSSRGADLLKQAMRGSVGSAVNADKKYWRKPAT